MVWGCGSVGVCVWVWVCMGVRAWVCVGVQMVEVGVCRGCMYVYRFPTMPYQQCMGRNKKKYE